MGRVLYQPSHRLCPVCGVQAVAKSHYYDEDYCFPSRGGCGTSFPNLTIEVPGLARGVALEPYTDSNGDHSYFGELVSQLKYHSLSDPEKLALVDQAVAEIRKRGVVDELVKGARNLLVVPVPSSKKRTIQHVYRIAEGLANSKYRYLEALVKTTSTESKTMDIDGEYNEGDFRCGYKLRGYSVLLVDDTYGEGATLRACIQALKRSGADTIYFMSLCKNTRGGIKHSDHHPSTTFDGDILS